jgi:hypothetical protein
MKNQYEQFCNAVLLKSLGITILYELSGSTLQLKRWIKQTGSVQINYPNNFKDKLREIVNNSPN